MSLSPEVPVSLYWAWKEIKHCLDWMSKFCMGKVSASVKEKALINFSCGSQEYYGFQSISCHLCASLANNFLLCFFNFLELFLNFWVKNFPMRSQGVISFKSLPYEIVDFQMIFSLPEKMQIKYFSSVLHSVSANMFLIEDAALSLLWPCLLLSWTLSPPQKNLEGKHLIKWDVWVPYLARTASKVISKHGGICCIWAVVLKMEGLPL